MIPDADYGMMMFNLSDSYAETGELSNALHYLVQVKVIFDHLNDDDYQCACLERMGTIHRSLGDLNKALALFQKYYFLEKKACKTYTEDNHFKRDWQ